MSWQAYVDTSLVASGNVDKGALFSAAGDSAWAVTPGFNVTPDEVKKIASSFHLTGNSSPFFANGIFIEGVKYICVAHDDNQIYARSGKAGVVISKTKQAIIIAHHPESIDRTKAATTTDALSDYLVKAGY